MLLVSVFGCGANKPTGYAHLRVEKEQKLRETTTLPLSFVFHRIDDTLCALYFKVHPEDFLAKYDSMQVLETHFKLSLEVRANQLGSKVYFFGEKDRVLTQNEAVIDSLNFALPANKTVYYELKIMDENKHVVRTFSAFWERDSDFIPEDFLILDDETQKVYTEPFITHQKVEIVNRYASSLFGLEIFEGTQNLATPMYQMTDNPLYAKLDAPEFKIGNLQEINQTVQACNKEVYFRIKEHNRDKSPYFSFTKVKALDDRTTAPLAYLLPDHQLPSNETWVKFWNTASSNDPQKAERLIGEFNRRVHFANDNFSSHKLGWKTDRGMVYIILGPPDRIINEVRSEVWSYGFTSSVAREFVFVRNPNGLHAQDFVLERNMGYREVYLSEVNRWEKGRVKLGWDGNQ